LTVGEDGDWISEEDELRLPTSPDAYDAERLRARAEIEVASGEPREGDRIMSHATRLVAMRLEKLQRDDPDLYLTETRHLQPAIRAALAEIQAGEVDQSEIRVFLPNWDPIPGGIDVVVRGPSGKPRFAAELKLHDTHWTLWDALKMIDLRVHSDLESAYLIVGATNQGWSSTFRICEANHKTTELFEPGDQVHETREVFRTNAHAWYDLLTGGTARPTQVPELIRTVQIADVPLTIDGKEGALRCVRVEPASDSWLSFSPDHYGGEWPIGVEPCEHYLPWREQQDAAED
jgi:hypothetical protein